MNRLKYVAILLAILLIFTTFPSFATGSIDVGIAKDIWLNKTVESVAEYLKKLNYQPSPDNENGLLHNVLWEFSNEKKSPYSVRLFFNTSNRLVMRVNLEFTNDAELFQQLYGSLALLYGEPSYSEYSQVTEGKSIILTPEAYNWKDGSLFYSLICAQLSADHATKMQDAISGNAPFALAISQFDDDDEKPKESMKPTKAPKPTATPKPVQLEVSISNVQIKQTNSGTKQFYIRFKNNSSQVIDRIDFRVEGFNRYGEKIMRYNTSAVDFYYDMEIKPGQQTRSDWRYTYYMLNEATSIKIAIMKYHKANGTTVEVPEYQLKWERFE